MARKAVERNIAYDDQRKLYYVSMELGRDESGKRLKRYRTFHTLAAARNGLRAFHAGAEREQAEKAGLRSGAGSVPLAGVLDEFHCPAQSGGDHRVRLSEDHRQPH